MRRMILTSVLFFTLFLIFIGCENPCVKCNELRKSKGDVCFNYDTIPVSTLKIGLIDQMVSDYKANKRITLDEPSRQDSHSIWFDLETLKAFIYNIEKNIQENIESNIDDEILGIRIYYADYPDEETWISDGDIFHDDLNIFAFDDEKKLYAKMHTLIMIPTRRINFDNGDFKDVDVDIRDIKTYKEGLISLTANDSLIKENFDLEVPALSGIPNVYNNINTIQTQRIGAQNHGSLIPPRDVPGEEAFLN